MPKQQKTYTKEFKLEAVRLVRSSGKPMSQIARELGPDHPYTASTLYNLAGLYQAQGKYLKAEPLLRRALAICEQQLGASHPMTQIVRQNYTSLLQDFSPQNEKR